MRRLSSIIFTLFLVMGTGISAQESSTRSADIRISRGYLQQARVLYREGRYESALQLLEVSLEFFPEYSESAFLCALVYLRRQDPTWKAIECLEAAVRAGTWMETEPMTAAAELVRLYVRTGRFREARRMISALGDTGLGGRGNSDLSALWARTLIGLGEMEEAQAFLAKAVRRFPQSPELYVLLAELLTLRGSRTAAGEVLQRGIKEMPREPELAYRLAALERDPERRLELVERYFQAGGSDPGAALLAVPGAGRDRQRFIGLFFRLGGNTRIGYLDTLLDLVAAEEIPEEVGAYSGTRIMDANRDGYYEQRYEYQEGILTKWIADQDQNGIAEATVEFEDGKPRIVTLSTGESSRDLRYRYSEYPFLESAALLSGPTRTEYRIFPYTLRRPAFVAISGERFALELRSDLIDGEDSIRQNAYQKVEYSGNSPFADRRAHLADGRAVRVDELPDYRGNFTRTVFYADSMPIEGIRDLDGDGNPEIREEFQSGRLWKITLDQDGDGVKEFEQVFETDSIRSYWDYNNDGLYDSRESTRSDGLHVRSFSSLLNGAYDLTESGEALR